MAGVSGPTSFTVTPNPFDTTLTLNWSGLSFSGLTVDRSVRYAWRYSSDNATWSGWYGDTIYYTTASSYSLRVTLPNVAKGSYVQYQLYGRGYTSGNSYYTGTVMYATTRKIAESPCVAPSACSVSVALAEGNVTLSWSGAAAGTSNAINGYEIQYSDSADGTSWGIWNALQTVNNTATSGTLSVSPPSVRGNYRRFQVRTLGAAGAAYYSPWKISTNTVRRNTLPSAPTIFTAQPESYLNEDITLSWSGAAAGTSAIKNYVIQKSESIDQVSWSAWAMIGTVTTTATSGEKTVTPSNVAGTYTQYRICTTDALGCISSYKTSNSILRISLPLAPVILAPKAGAVTYNQQPLVLIQTQPSPLSAQTVFVRATDGQWYNSVEHPAMFSPSGSSEAAVLTAFTNPDTPVGTASVTVNVRTEHGAGASVTCRFTVEPSPFETIIANETIVKAVHILSLRTAINQIRNYYGMPPYVWNEEILPRRTNVHYWPFHIQELRAALEGVGGTIKNKHIGSRRIAPVEWLDVGTGRPRADVMEQLRGLVLSR